MGDRTIGGALLVGGILAFIGYVYLLFFVSFFVAVTVIMIIAVGAITGILAWIGYTLLTTPAPQPLEGTETTAAATPTGSSASAASKSGTLSAVLEERSVRL